METGGLHRAAVGHFKCSCLDAQNSFWLKSLLCKLGMAHRTHGVWMCGHLEKHDAEGILKPHQAMQEGNTVIRGLGGGSGRQNP